MCVPSRAIQVQITESVRRRVRGKKACRPFIHTISRPGDVSGKDKRQKPEPVERHAEITELLAWEEHTRGSCSRESFIKTYSQS